MSTLKSSAEDLTLNADGSGNDIKFQSNGVEKASIDQAGNLVLSGTLTSAGIDDNADATAITIDSSENVMVNKTSQNMATVGSQFRGDAVGLLQITRDGSETLHLNRLTDDGNVLSVYKDTTLKGSIAVTDSGIGIQLGGTGTANTLDDYEEGTFTPQIYVDSSHTGVTYDAQSGVYTKVGNLVNCFVCIGLSSKGSASGNVTFRNLPFTIANSSAVTALDGGAANWGYFAGTSGINYFTFVGNGSVNYATGYAQTGSTGDCNVTFTNNHITDGFSLRFTFQFLTDS